MSDLFHVDYEALDTAPERMIAEAHIAQLRGLGVLVKVEATDRICVEHYRMPTEDDSHCDIRGVSTRCKMVDVVRVPKEDTTNSDSISSRLVDPRPAAFRVALNDMVGHEPKEDEA